MALASAEDLAVIQRNFAIFKENIQASMVVFYQFLLRENPGYFHMFPLDGVSPDDFPNNHYVRDIQGPKTGAAVCKIMSVLDNPDQLRGVMHRLVNMPKHTKWSLSFDEYKNGFHSMMGAIKHVLGDRMTESDMAAWKRFSASMMKIIDEEVQALQAKQASAQ